MAVAFGKSPKLKSNHMERIYTFVSAAVLSALSMTAQSSVDIGLFQNNAGQLEVKVRPQSGFDGIVSSLVFTIRWDRTTGATLGDPVQVDQTLQYIPMSRSGDVREVGGLNYQVFAGFGFQRMANTGNSWVAGQEYTIMTIPVTGSAGFELVNDSWTGELQNNADFYTSLGGEDRTGVIYKSLAAPANFESTVSILPNPNDGVFNFTFLVSEVSDVRVEILNTLGQNVYAENLPQFQGTFNKAMDLTTKSNGIYYLKITRGGETSVHKIVYR